MTQARTELLSALNDNETKRIQSLIFDSSAPVSIHQPQPNSHSHTPLQHALSLPSPYPLQTLLTSFFSSSHPSHLAEHRAVIDELIGRLYPSYQPHIEETKEGSMISVDQSDAAIMSRVRRALSSISEGSFVVVCDGEDRENEGDLIIAAECVNAEKIAFMVNETSGIICVGITAGRANELNLPQMVEKNTEAHQTAFTISVDYNINTSTGISAADRAATILALASPHTQPQDLSRPGHIFPLRARDGGVLVRPGHTEASVDLARLSGKSAVGVMCEIVNRDGTMARPNALRAWSERHQLPYITIADLVYYRQQTEQPQQ